MALDHPETVLRVAVLDIAPTAMMYATTDRSFATAYYHWFFLIQPAPLPETLIGAYPDYYLRATLEAWSKSGMSVFRSEEHTSELQSLMRISYAVFCLKKKTKTNSQ